MYNSLHVCYRDINIKKTSNYAFYIQQKEYLDFDICYYGGYLIVNKIYRSQNLLLFMYYIYGLILENIEQVNELNVEYRRIYYRINDHSSISKTFSHTHCPYCSQNFKPSTIIGNGKKEVVIRNNLQKINYKTDNWLISEPFKNELTTSRMTTYHYYFPIIYGSFLEKVIKRANTKKEIENRNGPKTLGINLLFSLDESKSELLHFFRNFEKVLYKSFFKLI